MTRLSFTEKPWRAYALDGKKIPSVTQITGAALAKPQLLRWAAKETALWASLNTESLGSVLDTDAWVREATGAADRHRDKAAQDGKDLHTLAEALVYGDPMPEEVDGRPVPGHVRDMAEQVARFLDAWNVVPVIHEAMVYSDTYRYGGRLDLVADMGGDRWILDYKTGESGIWPETAIQLSAYGFATHYVDSESTDVEIESLGITRAAAIWVRPDSWAVVPVRFDRDVFGTFRHMGAVWSFTQISRGINVLPALPYPAKDAT